jgi:hypothetical protein
MLRRYVLPGNPSAARTPAWRSQDQGPRRFSPTKTFSGDYQIATPRVPRQFKTPAPVPEQVERHGGWRGGTENGDQAWPQISPRIGAVHTSPIGNQRPIYQPEVNTLIGIETLNSKPIGNQRPIYQPEVNTLIGIETLNSKPIGNQRPIYQPEVNTLIGIETLNPKPIGNQRPIYQPEVNTLI